jgi:hypothetical protein
MVGTGANAGSRIYLYNENASADESSIYVDLVSESQITGDSYTVTLTDFIIDADGDTSYSVLNTAARGDELTHTGISLRNTTTATDLITSRLTTLSSLGSESLPVVEGFRVVADDANDGQPGVYDWSVVDVPDSSGWTVYTDLRPYYRGSLERAITRDAYWDFEVIWRTINPTSGDTNKAIQSGVTPKIEVNAPFEIWRLDTNTRVWPIITDWYGSGIDYDTGWERIYVTDIPYTDDFFDPVLYPEHEANNATGYWTRVEDDPVNSQCDWLWAFDWDEWSADTWYENETWVATVYKPLAADLSVTIPSFSNTAPAIEDSLIDYDDIMAVPNPYIINAEWDQNRNRRKIQFTNVPANATIDIYTLAGELIASLDHGGFVNPDTGTRNYNSDMIGTVDWKIWTYEYTEAAYGLYIYVVKVGDDVKKVGKLAIIR